ncbi:hypothetical protein FRC03_008341 [Tulasnella sp. 419]|nr:hypothetical protein FRC02_009005 [Tulasnella sp. 418]KAG8968206.1 hypothetical protein FRC03_008341 [Tulasnella sp. 419]
MAAPSSESTSPSASPPISSQTMVYPTSVSTSSTSPASRSLKRSHQGIDPSHSPNLDAFLTTARYGKIARELRARLSYANFKATHNASHLPLNALEQQFRPVKQGRTSPITEPVSPRHRLTHTQMMPPPPSPSSKSLYSALLGSASVPSSKRARLSTADARTQSISNFDPPIGSRSIRSRPGFPTTDGDDINAAATLTSLLLNRPATKSESSLSRTSSDASLTAFQSSQQTQLSQNSQTSSYSSHHKPTRSSSSVLAPSARPRTPEPDDAQAAELMLYLATSPSPVRKASNRSDDQTRPARQPFTASRVLFPSTDKPDPAALSAQATAIQASQHGRHSSASSMSQLLPPPPSPTSRSSHKRSQSDLTHVPLTPQTSFNLGDFINVSPSPQRNSTASKRAPVIGKAEGRRLFMDDDPPVVSNALTSSFSSSSVRSPNSRSARYSTGKRPSAGTRKSATPSVIGARTGLTPALGTTVAGA